MLERGFILPNYDFKRPNPKIPWKEWNLKVPVSQRPWPKGKKYISVNNFGFGGTNGHVVLEAPPFRKPRLSPAAGNETPDDPGHGRRLYVITANDKAALSQVAKNIVIYLEQRPEIFQKDLPANLAYTLGQRRSLLQWRVAIPALNSFELIEAINGEKFTPGKETEQLRIGFIFTGQGAQWHAMGRELYEQYPTFSSSIHRADQCLVENGAEWSLIGKDSDLFHRQLADFFVDELDKDAKDSRVSEAHISQPSCTAIQLALVDLLRSWGVRPTAVAGHSSGEIAAAYAAEIIDFESAMTIAYHRGRLIPILKSRHPDLRGRMMAVGGSKEEFQPILDGLKEKEARIACYNSPSSLTISGDEPAIAELEKICQEKQVFNRRLVVDVAYHSHHMDLVAKEYRASLACARSPVPTDIRFHSSLHGHLVDGTELQSGYWVDNLTCAVRFSEALQSMLEPAGEHKHGVNMLVELGPHSGLQGPIKQVLKEVGGSAMKIPYASALVRKRDAVETALELAASLFAKGANLDFGAINFPAPTKAPMLLTDLPRYPWNYSSKYWQESRMTKMHKHAPGGRSDILGTLANYSNDLEPTWRNIIRLDDLPWLQHHKIQSLTIFPMAGFIAMALEAAAQRAATRNASLDRFELKEVSITKPLVIPDKDTEMTITLRPRQELTSETWDEFRICSWSSEQGWTEHCIGLIAALGMNENNVDGARQARDTESRLRSALSSTGRPEAALVTPAVMYDSLTELGVAYGSLFQGITNCHASDAHAVGDIVVPDVAKEMPNGYLTDAVIQPAFLESLIEMYWPIVGAGRRAINTIYLPSSVDQMTVSLNVGRFAKTPGSAVRAICEGEMPTGAPRPTKVSMTAVAGDDSLEAIISLDGLMISPIMDGETETNINAPRDLCYKLEWDPILQTKDENPPFSGDTEVVIIHESSSFQSVVAMCVANSLERATGRLPDFGTLGSVETAGKVCVFLNELHQPFLAPLNPTKFGSLQKLLTSVEGVLWVVRGAYNKSANPDANMVTGLSRTIRSETAMKFATLDLDAEREPSELDTVNAIINVFNFVFGPASSATGELEFREKAGAFFTPRIVLDPDMNAYVHNQTNPSVLEMTPFGDDNRALKMEMSTPGALDTIHFVDDLSIDQPLGSDEIEIEVKAIGLNFKDGMAAKGLVPLASSGLEASGVVIAVGAKVAGFQAGDRVAAFTQGAFATRARAKASFAFKIPRYISLEAAASLPLAYSTAYYSLVELGRLGEGETVLIHSAAGAVGQAAICVAQMIGAEVFATVGNAEKKRLLLKEYGLQEDHIFYSRNNSFADAIRHATNGQGIDVILNSLTGDGFRESWKCLNKFGRFIEIGKRESGSKARLDVDSMDSNASFISLDMFTLIAERPKIVKRLLADVAQVLKYGKIRPVTPVMQFAISDVEAALKAQQTGNMMGKLVVVPRATDVVKVRSFQSQLIRRSVTNTRITGGKIEEGKATSSP
jgi:NADPH:quinone reductase-like Zn-dependent oxidoreductase/malonyl CoA-acyl carrier protein transacylase